MTNAENNQLKTLNAFTSVHGHGNNGFPTQNIAMEYSRLKIAWWGSNLVSTGIEKRDGRFYAGFNVWD